MCLGLQWLIFQINDLGGKIEYGVISVTFSTTEQSTHVTFKNSYNYTPSVICSPFRYGYTTTTFAIIQNTTIYGVNILYTTTNVSGATGGFINWIAIGN